MVVGILIVAGIAWVHYYYIPHTAITPIVLSTAQNAVVRSTKTVEAMQTIQYLIQQVGTSSLDAMPVSRTFLPVFATDTSEFSYFGFTFTAPWKDITAIKEAGTPVAVVTIAFTNGRRISFEKAPAADVSDMKTISHLSGQPPTEYGFENAVLNATPDQVTSSTPDNLANLIAILLTLKSTIFVIGGPIYSFDTGVVKGFQYGDATSTKSTTRIDLFDKNDDKYVAIITGTQGEIDYILASIKEK
jgi:hypothetical protein